MKRKFLIITAVFMVFAMVMALGSCDALSGLFGEPEPPAPDIDINDVYGTWEREISGGTEVYVFSENMRYTRTKLGATNMGTYSVSGNELTTTASENTRDVSVHIVRFSEDKNTMTWGEGSIKSEFTRKK